MLQRVLVGMLFGSLAWGQMAPAAPQPTPAAPTALDAKSSEASNLPPDTPVITIQGICDHPAGDKSAVADCKIVVTKAEFDAIIRAIGSNMPATARRQLATRYGSALVMAQKAHEMGLDQGPKFEEMMKLKRLEISMQLVTQAVQQKASEVPDKDIEDYYNKNLASYEEATFERLFIPRNKQLDTPKVKLTPAENQKRQDDATAEMKKETDTLRARAVAGEDFTKLQLEAYTFAGLKSTPPTQKLNKARRNSLPPAQASIFELKAGEVSPVITDMSGYFVYKLVDKDALPLTQVHDEIFGTLKSEKVQEAMQALQHSGTPELNDGYFGPADATPAPPMSGHTPTSQLPRPGPKPPTLGPK
ncbi:MAG TPA: peptidylprolyl isomerase [Terriglobales bacterium]|nr:peptidylprolyl isomerase [Terriglobales bacterium]